MALYAVSVKEAQDTVADFAQQKGITFPILLDGDGEVALNYLVFKHPEIFFIDQDGIIRQRIIGFIDKKTIISKYEQTRQAASSARSS